MKKIILGLIILAAPVFLIAAAGDYVSTVTKVGFAIPKDINGIALHDQSLGLPYFSEAVTLNTSAFTALVTLPTSGNNANRQWRKIMVRNPNGSKLLYLCFGGASCSTSMLKVPTSTTIVLDGMYFGPMNTITTIYGKLDSDGTDVVPEVTVW